MPIAPTHYIGGKLQLIKTFQYENSPGKVFKLNKSCIPLQQHRAKIKLWIYCRFQHFQIPSYIYSCCESALRGIKIIKSETREKIKKFYRIGTGSKHNFTPQLMFIIISKNWFINIHFIVQFYQEKNYNWLSSSEPQ